MSVVTPLPASPVTSKQRAKLLVKMANAVEDSSARRRQRLQDKTNIDGETVDQLIDDLEREMSGMSHRDRLIQFYQKHNPAKLDTVDSTLELYKGKEDVLFRTLEEEKYKTKSHPGRGAMPVNPQQVRLLYTAMIRYRENSDLRYQLLELRYLDLSKSFLELESRYRRMESEQQAWKQSCQALQQAASEGSLDVSSRTKGSLDVSRNKLSTSTRGTSEAAGTSRFKKSTLPILQEELKMLSSQRNQLLQANLELRKQLKQMQIQMQTPKAEDSMTATCHRCHPELLAGRQQFAEEALTEIVEFFHSSTTSFPAAEHNNSMNLSRQNLNLEESKEMEPQEEEESDTQLLAEGEGVPKQGTLEEHQHQDKMNLLGIQFSGNTGRPTSGSPNQIATTPTKQKSIVWSPPPAQTPGRTAPAPISPDLHQAKPKARMAPTMNSILPMHPPKKQSQDIRVSPRRDIPPAAIPTNSESLEQSFQDFQHHEVVTPNKTPVPKELQATPLTSNTSASTKSPKQGMDRFGMLDEFGRSISYRLNSNSAGGTSTLNINTNNSGTTAPTSNTTPSNGKGMGRFRRKPVALVPQPQPAPAPNTANRPRRRTTPGATAPQPASAPPNARHLEYHLPGRPSQPQPPPSPKQPPMMTNARHLEFAAPGQNLNSPPATSPPRRQLQQQQAPPHHHPGGGQQPRRASYQQHLDRKHSVAGRNPASHPHAGAGPHRGSVNPRGGRGHSLRAGPMGFQHPGSGAMQSQRRQSSHQQYQQQHHQQQRKQPTAGKSSQEEKPERVSRPQSYFERIKKTLQQEI